MSGREGKSDSFAGLMVIISSLLVHRSSHYFTLSSRTATNCRHVMTYDNWRTPFLTINGLFEDIDQFVGKTTRIGNFVDTVPMAPVFAFFAFVANKHRFFTQITSAVDFHSSTEPMVY